MADPRERLRKIDLDSLPTEERDRLAAEVGAFVSNKVNVTIDEIRKVLSVYGLDFHMLWEMVPEDSLPMWRNPKWFKENLEVFAKQAKKAKAAEKKTLPKKNPSVKKAGAQKKAPVKS